MRKGYFIGVCIGIAVIVIAALLFIGFAPEGAKASIMLKDEQGNPITATKIVLDGADLGSATGEVTPEVLDVGGHIIIIFWGGAKYTKTFYYSGEETIILVQLSNPVETRISVWNEDLNQPIANVTVYVDGEVQDTTSADGFITITLEPGSHTFRLLGSGVSHEEIRAVSAEANFVEFKVERTSVITVSVSDELTGNPVKSAAVYFDGVYKRETPASGTLEIRDVKDGLHQIEVRYKNLSTEESIMVTQTVTSFSLSVPVPRIVTLAIIDEETALPVIEIDVYVDAEKKGTTTQDGELIVEDILPGSHRVSLDVPGYTGMVERYIDVGTQDRIPLTIDMPNPEFQAVGIEVNSWYDILALDEKGRVTVSLTNLGDVSSEDTFAVVLVYTIVDGEMGEMIGSRLLRFGNLASGADPVERETGEMSEFRWAVEEDVVVVVFDRWRYTPQNEGVIGEVYVPNSVVTEWVLEGKNYITEHPEEVAKIAGIFIGNIVKTIFL